MATTPIRKNAEPLRAKRAASAGLIFAGLAAALTAAPAAASAQNGPAKLQYRFRAGMDLVYGATFEMRAEGGYSEDSVRYFENRFVIRDVDETGQLDVLGLTKLVSRTIGGQRVDAPFGKFQAYSFSFNPDFGFFRYTSGEPEFGTGWTPMACFPPLPGTEIRENERTVATLPIYAGIATARKADFNVITRRLREDGAEFLASMSLMDAVALQTVPLIQLDYQEHTVRLDWRRGIPAGSRGGYQTRIETAGLSTYVSINTESELIEAQIFREEDLPAVNREITRFFELKTQLVQSGPLEAERAAQAMIEYSENSPIPILREAANELAQRHRHEQRLQENRLKTGAGAVAPPLQSRTVMAEPLTIPAEDKATVLLFWALWWPPSEQALMDLETIRQSTQTGKIEFIGVNLDSTHAIAREYSQKSGFGIPIVWDEEYPREGIAFEYGVADLPTIVVLDAKGKVLARDPDQAELIRLVRRLD